MTREETLKIAYNKRKNSAGEEREFYNAVISALEKEDIYDDGEHNAFYKSRYERRYRMIDIFVQQYNRDLNYWYHIKRSPWSNNPLRERRLFKCR